MTTNGLAAAASVCGAGILLAIIVFFAHLPLILLAVPAVIVLAGFVLAQVTEPEMAREIIALITAIW